MSNLDPEDLKSFGQFNGGSVGEPKPELGKGLIRKTPRGVFGGRNLRGVFGGASGPDLSGGLLDEAQSQMIATYYARMLVENGMDPEEAENEAQGALQLDTWLKSDNPIPPRRGPSPQLDQFMGNKPQ